MTIEIHGTVAKGFESVKALFERNLNTYAEDKAQLCVYHKGEKVVDLWASVSSDSGFSPDTLINIFSSGKSLESIALASLVDKGLLDYSARISDYWPEFAANGKAELTVADLMRHEAGLANFAKPMALDALLTDNIKKNLVGEYIEAHPLKYAGDEKREYHAVTRGWIANELFRRADPAGRTIGEFLRQDINQPLGVKALVGLQREELDKRAAVKDLGLRFQFLQSLLPKFLGRKIVHNIFQILGRLLRVIPALRRSNSKGIAVPFEGMKDIDYFNNDDVARGETPSANTHSNANSLARIAAMMAARGQFNGHTYLGERGWNALHDNALEANMGGLFQTRFTQGGVNQFTPCAQGCSKMEREFNEGREGFYGWMGLGGSIFQWHPELDIGFGFVPTSLHVLDFLNERGKTYQAEVLKCVQRLS